MMWHTRKSYGGDLWWCGIEVKIMLSMQGGCLLYILASVWLELYGISYALKTNKYLEDFQ